METGIFMGKWPFYTKEARREVDELLKAGGSLSAYRANPKFGIGPREGSKVYELERAVEKQFRVKHAVATNSGTAALHLALSALDLRGREVITSPYTFSATAAAILQAGGTPVFADVDPHTFCITAETVKPYVSKKTACILPVHLFGYYQDLSELEALGIPIVEDACQAVGASRGDSFAGTAGLVGCYSFNGAKNVPAGEGGCLVTNDDKVAERARLLANHQENFNQTTVGFNYRMHEVVAVLVRHGLESLDERNEMRRGLAVRFRACAVFGCLPLWVTPGWSLASEWWAHAVYVCPAIYKGGNRERFCANLRARGVEVSGGYITPPLHHYPAFRKYAKRKLSIVDDLSFRKLVLFTQLCPPATVKDMESMAGQIKEVWHDEETRHDGVLGRKRACVS